MDSFTSYPLSLDPPPVLAAVLDGPSDSTSPADPSIDMARDVPMRGPSPRRAIHSWSHPCHPPVREKDKDTDLKSIDKISIIESSHNSSIHKLASSLYFHSHSKTCDTSHQPREKDKDTGLESIDKNSISESTHSWPHILYFHSHSKTRDTSKHLDPPASHSNAKKISSSLESTTKDPSSESAVRGASLESTGRGTSLELKDGKTVPHSVTKSPVHDLVTQEPTLESPSNHSLSQSLYFQSHSRSQKKPSKEKNAEVESLSRHSSWPHLLYFQSHSRFSLQDKRSVHESPSKVKHSINRLSLDNFKASKGEERVYYGKRVIDMFEWAETEVVDVKGIDLQESIPCSIFIGTDKVNSVEFILHKTILCKQSLYFRKAFEEQGRYRGIRASQYEQYPTITLNRQELQEVEKEDELHLPGTPRPIFDLLVRWLYHIESTWTINNAHLLLQLYVVADKFGIEGLKDDCVNLIIPLVSSEYPFHGLDVAYVYQNTNPDSPLRRLIVRIVGYHAKNGKLLDRSGERQASIMRQVNKNGEFAVDLVRALAETDERLVRPEDEWSCKWHGHE